MNKLLKIGLIFQIPNILAVLVVLLALINWNFMLENAGLIILGSIFALFNVFSIILITLGLLE